MNDLEARLEALQQQLKSDFDVKDRLTELCAYLEGSEYKLIELMVHNHIWQGEIPPKPNDEGEVEFGLVPYWVHNPPGFIEAYFDEYPVLKVIFDAMSGVFLSCHIDATNYASLKAHAETKQGIVAGDGAIYGDGKYEQLDETWLYAFLNYLIVHYGHDRAPFVDGEVSPVMLKGATAQKVRIGILGDWGTGIWADGKQAQCPSQQIMAQLLAMQPDYIIHLGDVYYAGTGGDFLPFNEEQKNLLDVWPKSTQFPAKRSFTLNSNHEMYSGAKGYYQALADPRFGAQLGTSYFALRYGSWTILGLDAGYFSNAPLFMQGSIGGSEGVQGAWIQSLRIDPSSTIVMTHHNALMTDGRGIVENKSSPQGSLWAEVVGALGAAPAYWYWGHIHNGIVYRTPNSNGSKTMCRCVGHSAIPFGQAWGVHGAPKVGWFSDDLNQNIDNGVRVNNGFGLIDIKNDGSVYESIWAQGKSRMPVWFSGRDRGYIW